MREEGEFDFNDILDRDYLPFICPECGDPLYLVTFIYRNGNLGIEVTCEWCDYVGFKIELDCKKRDLRKFRRKLGVFKATLQELRKA